MKVAIAINTKDRVELSRQSIKPLHDGQHALFWFDGSDTPEGQALPGGYLLTGYYGNVTGGAGNALVFALHTLLNHSARYDFIGIVENDTLLPDDWFEPTMALFERGANEGLEVGAVSARCYADRILVQRDGYALCHNLGAGHIVFTRQAAEIVLASFRSGWTIDNRRVFNRLSGIDIGNSWAFGQHAHFLTADWHWEVALACHGLSALALTPSHVEMIGQDPPLEQQGLRIASEPVESLRNDFAFEKFSRNTMGVRNGLLDLGLDPVYHRDIDGGAHTYFAHQLAALGGQYRGGWRVKDIRRLGPLTWVADEPKAELLISLTGACSLLVSGGDKGARCKVEDESGFLIEPSIGAESAQGLLASLNLPGVLDTRKVKLTALEPGLRFYGIQSREPQMTNPQIKFDGFDIGRRP